MTLTQIIILSIIQGLAELLPVSSSAHVIAAAKIFHLDPTTPQFVLMLVMLHTGTMFAVIVYFAKAWKRTFFHSQDEFVRFATKIVIATGITGFLGLGLQKGIEHLTDPGYTRLESWSISDTDPGHPRPTGSTLLTHLVATANGARLFKAGETLTLNVKKNGDPLPYEPITVAPTSSLNDLLTSFRHGFAIDTKRMPTRSGIPKPGVTLIQDDNNPKAVHIVITGNEGHENKYKLADGFVDSAEQVRINFADTTKGEVEHLFKRMDLIAYALAAAGVLIFFTGIVIYFMKAGRKGITTADGIWLGVTQGLSLPFRGFSRSGATISVGLLRGISRQRAEEFSFAMAVALTPPVLLYEAYRMYEHAKATTPIPLGISDFMPGIKGLIFSFLAGLVALKVLSKLLEKGQWWIFGIYCLAAATAVYWMHTHGYGN
ncbi:MAG TPA: undecaprenyl-diphosphate phosphatase [Tepidisphaeraceae bacterium]|jgi:undecaprenyl pyrophosphate phosphatase UppP|nr:undecaprenyl-diphosphate phosphatase [Tepidisphaeraceae bacterium]